MRLLLLFLALSLGLQAETFRVSRAFDRPAVQTEAMRLTKGGYTLIFHVEAAAIVTEKDIKEVSVVPKQKGMLMVTLTPEGAKKMSQATKGAAGMLRLAVLIDNELISVPLVGGELGKSLAISGLNGLEKEELEELAKGLMQGGAAEEKEEDKAE